MKGNQIQGILDHLKQTERLNIPDDHTIPFTKTNHFNYLWRNILVSDHDYMASGGSFNYICVEYIDSLARAKKAVNMFGHDGVQGEMDFFHVPGVGADWQVGHIGFSDHNHHYFILCMIICHSENAILARLLINRAVRLINESGGRLACILVDGGTALNKAIGDENAQNELLGEYIFLTAIEMLKSKFKEHLSVNIIKTYLNGNPNDLGGCCAGPAGTVASNQGGERRGGWMKKKISSILKMYGMTTTVNPVYFLIAAALDSRCRRILSSRSTRNCNRAKPNQDRGGCIQIIDATCKPQCNKGKLFK